MGRALGYITPGLVGGSTLALPSVGRYLGTLATRPADPFFRWLRLGRHDNDWLVPSVAGLLKSSGIAPCGSTTIPPLSDWGGGHNHTLS